MTASARWAWGCLLALGYTFFGYPLLLVCWARLAPHPVRREPIEPHVTLLIPAYNEADVIGRKLANTRTLDYPRDRLEVVVVDDGSDDGTADVVQEFIDDQVRLVNGGRRRGKMAAVNLGVREARGDIVVLSDASPSYAPDALRSAMSCFADPEVGVVSGQVRLFDSASAVERPAGLYWRYEDLIRRWESDTGLTVAVNGNFFAFRRELYDFPPESTINDEFSVAMQIAGKGRRIVYDPGAVTYDDASSTMDGEYARRARISAGRYQAMSHVPWGARPDLAFRLVSHKYTRLAAPVLLVTLLASTLARTARTTRIGRPRAPTRRDFVRMEGAVPWALLAAQGGLYGMAALGQAAERRGRRPKALSVPYYFVSGNLAGLAGLYRHLRKRQLVTWQKRTAPLTHDRRTGD